MEEELLIELRRLTNRETPVILGITVVVTVLLALMAAVSYVFVVRGDNTAEVRPVTAGRAVGDRGAFERLDLLARHGEHDRLRLSARQLPFVL